MDNDARKKRMHGALKFSLFSIIPGFIMALFGMLYQINWLSAMGTCLMMSGLGYFCGWVDGTLVAERAAEEEA